MSLEYIEITERTVSEAVTAACQKLGVPSERIEYEVIDQGKAGFLGFGTRAAKIRARVRQGMDEVTEIDASAIISDVLKGKEEKKAQAPASGEKPEKKRDAAREAGKEDRARRQAKAKEAPVEKASAEQAPAQDAPAEKGEDNSPSEAREVPAGADRPAENARSGRYGRSGSRESFESREDRGYERSGRDRVRSRHRRGRYEGEEAAGYARTAPAEGAEPARSAAQKKRSAVPVLTEEQVGEVRSRAAAFLGDVFRAMDLEAEIETVYHSETGMLTLDIKGENMGILIGKRGQTLDSLQYLVSLVVNKGVDGYIHVKADTENYRERRKKTLENLAKNIAAKVKRNRASVALEPMNPYERRIIHSALQGDRYVTTYSEGEEPYRKVIVTMKEM